MYKATFNIRQVTYNKYQGRSIPEAFGDLVLINSDTKDVQFWRSLSGAWGKGMLPTGEYIIGPVRTLPDTKKNNSFKGKGVPWFAPITPKFKTDRTELGIHPDGGIDGTSGCLSPIKSEDDQKLLSLLTYINTVLKQIKIPLSVSLIDSRVS